jgi:thiamine kinase-like enzyme
MINIKEADKIFPGFSNAFDMDAIKKFIVEAFKRNLKEISVEKCEISDVKYEPGRQCIILYRTKLTDMNLGKRWKQLFLGKVLMKDEEEDLAFPKEAFLSKEMGIIFSPFPHDPVISWLPEVYDKRIMKNKLKILIPKSQFKINKLKISLMAYTPQMRATFLYEIDLQDKISGKFDKWEWIAKTNVFKPSYRVFGNYLALWKGAKENIAMPRPIGFLTYPQMTFQEKIKGIRLGAIVDDPNIDLIMQNAARSIATFHNLKIPVSNIRKLEQEVKTLNRWSEVLINLRPDLKMRMEDLRKEIVSKMEQWFQVEGPIHADFHHTNLLVDDTKVQLIDMDEMSLGDPCVDVGRFLSSLRIPSLRTFGSFDGLKPQREKFLETYLQHSPKDERKIRLFEAASLFTSAASAFRLQRVKWESEVAMLLTESEKAFQEAKRGKQVFLSPQSKSTTLSKENIIEWAKDGEYMKTILSSHFFQKKNQVLIQCEFLKISANKGFDRLYYRTTSLAERKKVKSKVDVFIHRQRDSRSVFDYLEFLNKKLEDTEAALFFPKPIGVLTELGGLALYGTKGKSITAVLGTSDALDIADLLAKGLALFHKIEVDLDDCNMTTIQSKRYEKKQDLHPRIRELKSQITEKIKRRPPKISYVLRNVVLSKFRVKGKWVYVLFPIRKYVAHPFRDIGSFISKMLLYGIKNKKIAESRLFIERLKYTYSQMMNVGHEEISLFEAEAFAEEANQLLNESKHEKLSIELIKEAEAKILEYGEYAGIRENKG